MFHSMNDLGTGLFQRKTGRLFMTRKIGLWILAFIITVASAVYQKKTGPTYPLSGRVDLAGTPIEYKLLRSHDVGDQPVTIKVADSNVHAALVYRRYNSVDDWTRKELTQDKDVLQSSLPHQPPAGKLEYFIELRKGEQALRLPANGQVITRFKGFVPLVVLLPHIIFMFAAMFLSTRAALAAMFGSTRLREYALWTVGLLFLGGMIFGPLVQKYAFGAYWTGFPFGYDLTDNKTLIALLAWLVALWATYKRPKSQGWVIAAAIVTMTIFMIPHSLLGSELDYSKIPAGQ
jgi:hypothetical protein